MVLLDVAEDLQEEGAWKALLKAPTVLPGRNIHPVWEALEIIGGQRLRDVWVREYQFTMLVRVVMAGLIRSILRCSLRVIPLGASLPC